MILAIMIIIFVLISGLCMPLRRHVFLLFLINSALVGFGIAREHYNAAIFSAFVAIMCLFWWASLKETNRYD